MDGILQVFALAAFIFAGAALPRVKRLGRRRLGRNGLAPPPRTVDLVLRIVLRVLLAAMGFRLGNDASLAARLAELGELALAAAVLATAGTLAAIVLGFALFKPLSLARRPRLGGESRAEGGGASRKGGVLARLKDPALLLAVVAAGLVLGLALPPLAAIDLPTITSWALYALLFFIGMQFAQSGISLKAALLKPENLIAPVATALGSLAGGLLLQPLFGLGPGKAMALVGGFGWYSLSGVIISDLGDPALGSAAFLANMIREAIALVSIPFLARSRLPQLAIGVGGATAMDVTLPLIEQCAGAQYAPASFASGALLSLAVPLIVPLLYRLG